VTEPKYIKFVENGLSKTGKTRRWIVYTKDGPDMMSNYAEIREMWQRYIKKLCKPNNFKSGGVN